MVRLNFGSAVSRLRFPPRCVSKLHTHIRWSRLFFVFFVSLFNESNCFLRSSLLSIEWLEIGNVNFSTLTTHNKVQRCTRSIANIYFKFIRKKKKMKLQCTQENGQRREFAVIETFNFIFDVIRRSISLRLPLHHFLLFSTDFFPRRHSV